MPSPAIGKSLFRRVEVSDYGRVKHASIEMAPLTLLVGRNNSGKSYIASLLWALMNFDDVFLGARDGDLLPDWFTAIAGDDWDESDAVVRVTPRMIDNWIDSVLRKRVSATVGRLLSLETATIGNIHVTCEGALQPCLMRRRAMPPGAGYTASWGLEEDEPELTFELEIAPGIVSVQRTIFSSLLSAMAGLPEEIGPGPHAVYIPAARTGLMLALGPLTASSYEALGIDAAEETTQLPLPTIRFLQALTRQRRRAGATGYEEVAHFLEQAILDGRIVRDQSTTPSFSYETTSDASLPLHAASSMVTELAPLLILLRNARFDRGLVFEEPEAHLHLSAQRAIARAIARLVNLGVPVVVTTHSDTFLQELNILMQLHAHDDRDRLLKRLKYDPEDLVDPAAVRGYEFIRQGDGTDVRQAEVSPYGIIVPSLNETLAALSDELMAIQE